MSCFKSIKTRLILRIWNYTPNCAEMSRLTSRSLDKPLPMRLRLRMRLHRLICIWCQRYSTQLNYLHQTAARFESKHPAAVGLNLSTVARRRITQRIMAAGGFLNVRNDG